MAIRAPDEANKKSLHEKKSVRYRNPAERAFIGIYR